MTSNKGKLTVLAASIIALPATSYALDFTPDASRVLSDPSYLPLQGQIAGLTAYHYGELKSDQYNYLGVKQNSLTETFQNIQQSLSYGITDDITIRASETYVPEQKKDYTSYQEYSFDGLEDPTFEAIWRALDQRTYPVSVDFLVGYSPDWVSDKNSSLNTTGSVGRGSDEEEMGVYVSYKTHSFTIQGLGGANHFADTTFYDPTFSANGKSSSYWTYHGGVATQTRLTDVFSVNLGDVYTMSNDRYFVSSTGVPYTNKTGGENDLNVALNYHIIPNRLVGQLTYDYYTFGDTSNDYSTATSDDKTKSRSENLFGVKMQYVF